MAYRAERLGFSGARCGELLSGCAGICAVCGEAARVETTIGQVGGFEKSGDSFSRLNYNITYVHKYDAHHFNSIILCFQTSCNELICKFSQESRKTNFFFQIFWIFSR